MARRNKRETRRAGRKATFETIVEMLLILIVASVIVFGLQFASMGGDVQAFMQTFD